MEVKNESEQEFVARCIEDEEMKSRYPDDDEREMFCKLSFIAKSTSNVSGDRDSGFAVASSGSSGAVEGLQDFREVQEELSVQRVNAKTKTLHGVAVLGSKSKNGRKYTNEALEDATSVFEGAKVYLNHRDNNGARRMPHRVENFVGRLQGLRVEEGIVRAEKLKVVNDNHWKLLSSIAENDPGAIGLSIDGEGVVSKGTVSKITSGRSVDVVAEPAATKSLFEEFDMDFSKLTLSTLREERNDIVKEIEDALREKYEKKIADLKARLSGKEEEDEETKESLDPNSILRKVVASGKTLTETQLKAVERLDTLEEVEDFLKGMDSKGSPKSKGKPTNEISDDSILECFAE